MRPWVWIFLTALLAAVLANIQVYDRELRLHVYAGEHVPTVDFAWRASKRQN